MVSRMPPAFDATDLTYRWSGPSDPSAPTVVLLHGLLLSRRMHEPLARSLAERGNRVVTLDLLGHGASPSLFRGISTGVAR